MASGVTYIRLLFECHLRKYNDVRSIWHLRMHRVVHFYATRKANRELWHLEFFSALRTKYKKADRKSWLDIKVYPHLRLGRLKCSCLYGFGAVPKHHISSSDGVSSVAEAAWDFIVECLRGCGLLPDPQPINFSPQNRLTLYPAHGMRTS
jgi:hypothetical protein